MDTNQENLQTLAQLLTGTPPDPSLDWGATIDLARQRGLSPFLFHAVRPFQPRISAEAWQALQGDYYVAVARCLLLERQLQQVLDALEHSQVPIVLLKGAALSRAVYPNPALRTMGDLDIWVPRDRMDTARTALEVLGYRTRSKQDRPPGLQELYLGETQMIRSEPHSALVELHWNVFPGEWLRHTARTDEQPIWERTIPMEGTDARQLSPEDAVLHTCVHFAIGHQLRGLGVRPLLDLELMQTTWAINWDTIAHRAREWQVATATWLILDLWTWLFGHQDRRVCFRALQPSPIRRWLLRKFAFSQLLAESQLLRNGPLRRLFLLLLVDRPVDAVVLLRQALFPEQEWLRLLYGLEDAPAWRVRLQQLWHPIRVLVRGDL